jgi:hypothetical protein
VTSNTFVVSETVGLHPPGVELSAGIDEPRPSISVTSGYLNHAGVARVLSVPLSQAERQALRASAEKT